MNTRLYIIEGLPCSGKSSTAKFTAGLTRGRLYDEDCGNHPADWEFTAFVPNSAGEFTPEEHAVLASLGERLPGGNAVPLNRLTEQYHGLFDRAFRYKIYDCLDWENERQVILHKWRSFMEQALASEQDSVFVFNCVLLQNPMCETMMRFNFESSVSYAFIREICGIITPLKPTVIYLKNSEIAGSVRKAAAERGDEWLSAVTDYHCSGGYGTANRLSGFEGYIAALEERQRRELEFLPKLPVKSLILNDPQRDWAEAYRIIEREITGNTSTGQK